MLLDLKYLLGSLQGFYVPSQTYNEYRTAVPKKIPKKASPEQLDRSALCVFRLKKNIQNNYISKAKLSKNDVMSLLISYIGSCLISAKKEPGEFPSTSVSFLYGFSSLWILSWLFKAPDCVKLLSHFVHLNGFSPVWVL